MGGLDRMDQNISSYCIALRSKKWWMTFFMFIPDTAVQKTWLLYRSSYSHDNEPTDLLSFLTESIGIERKNHKFGTYEIKKISSYALLIKYIS